MKSCSRCAIVKSLSEFGTRTRSADGLSYRCKACINAVARKRRRQRFAEDPEYRKKMNAYQLAWKRKRCAEDPGYYEKKNAYMRAWKRKRYAEDPEYRERVSARDAAYKRARRQRDSIRKERAPSPPGPSLDYETFLRLYFP